MSHQKTQEILQHELIEAQKLVKVGGIYSHSKHPQNLYKIIDLGIQEGTDKICVIYQSEYGKRLTFVRDLDNWLEEVEVNSQKVPRFKLVN